MPRLPLQPLHHHGQDQRAIKDCQGQDCRPAQGWNGLQDHHKNTVPTVKHRGGNMML